MSALLEYECRVPVDGYEIITFEDPEPEPPEDEDPPTVVIFGKWRILQPRSERTKPVHLFHNPSAFLEFAQTPDTLPASLDGIKEFADRYGPLEPDYEGRELRNQLGRKINHWCWRIREMRRTVELWQKSMMTGDFSRLIRAVQKRPEHALEDGVTVNLLLKEDPLSASARLCIRPQTLLHALWAQFVLAIDGHVNLGTCIQCRNWFTLEAGHGRSDKQYCSDACRMRAYRKRKSSG